MKKVTFFVITPILLITTSSCLAMQPATLTKKQQDKYFSDNWTIIPSKISKIYSVTAEHHYSDLIVATLKYKPAKNSIKLSYLNTTTHHIYTSSSFDLPENQKEASKLNFAFKNKTNAIIALDDTYFILPVPLEVIAQDNIKK
jgi:hypothetical protein